MKNKLRNKRITKKPIKKIPDFPLGTDFSVIEESPYAFEIIKQIAKEAGQQAQAELKAAGLENLVVEKGQIISIAPNGKRRIIPSSLKEKTPYYVKVDTSRTYNVRKK